MDLDIDESRLDKATSMENFGSKSFKYIFTNSETKFCVKERETCDSLKLTPTFVLLYHPLLFLPRKIAFAPLPPPPFRMCQHQRVSHRPRGSAESCYKVVKVV